MILNTFILIFVTCIWGIGFIATKWAFDDFSPLWITTIRFTYAGLLSIPLLIYMKTYKKPLKVIGQTFLISLCLFSFLYLQTIGLKYTSIAKCCFLTTFYAFFTPLIGMIIFKKKYPKSYWPIVFTGIIGVAFLCDLSFERVGLGDFLCLLGALLGACHILAIDRINKKFNSSFELNGLQCFFVSIIGILISLSIEGTTDLTPLYTNYWPLSMNSFYAFIIAGVLSCFVAFGLQAYAQKKIPPHIVGLIFLLEAPFGAILGHFLMDDKMTNLGIFGCFLIMLASALVLKFGKEIPNIEPSQASFEGNNAKVGT